MTIKALRRKRGLTLRSLSRLCGVAIGTINNYENGRTAMSPQTLRKVAQALGVADTSLVPPERVHPSARTARVGFSMSEQVMEEIRFRVEQFASSTPQDRKLLTRQITDRLAEYGQWCEEIGARPR